MAISIGLNGRLSGWNWAPVEKTDPPVGKTGLPPNCDPYLVWFDATCEMSEKLQIAHEVDLLVELPADLKARFKAGEELAKAGCRYRFPHPPPGDSGRHHKSVIPRFVTVSIPWSLVDDLVLNSTECGIVRFELASARYLPSPKGWKGTEAIDRHKKLAEKLFNWKFSEELHFAAKAELASNAAASPSSLPCPSTRNSKHAKPLLLVIDDYCNFSSRHLYESIKTVWHQGKSASTSIPTPASVMRGAAPEISNMWEYQDDEPPTLEAPAARGIAICRPPTEIGSGREHYGAILNFTTGAGKALLDWRDEVESYRQAQYHLPTPSWSHGTAVLSVLTRPASALPGVDPDGSTDLAAPTDIHFVQLPERAVLDTSGGSLAGFAIDAIRRAVRVATHHGHGCVVVNLSYGTHSGPHDGTSMFESAMLELLDFYNGESGRPVLHIVLPAGNSHLSRTHACGWLTSHGSEGGSQVLCWRVQPDDDSDSFVEIWLGQGANVEIELIAPSGESVLRVEQGEADPWYSHSISVEGRSEAVNVLGAAIIFPKTVAQGRTGTMALVAVSPTLRRRDFGFGERYRGDGTQGLTEGLRRIRMEAPAGVWRIKLRNLHKTDAASFHAWIQRDDAAPGRSRAGKGYAGRQSYFLDPPNSSTDPRFTLNGIATAVHAGRRLWVVGSMEESGRISRYSSAGPDRAVGNRCVGPDVVTIADGSRNNPRRVVGGTFSGSRLRLSGTSISAAVFSRMLHDSLKRNGPHHRMSWVPFCPEVEPLAQASFAGEAEQASDFYRGESVRLAHVEDIVGLKCG